MKTNTYLIAVWFASILIVASSCFYDAVIEIESEAPAAGEVFFQADIIPIFNKDCNGSGCHNGAVAPNLLPANAYNALINGNYINVGAPEESELYQWMRGKRNQPMPLSGPNATYNAKVLAWIKQGALNN